MAACWWWCSKWEFKEEPSIGHSDDGWPPFRVSDYVAWISKFNLTSWLCAQTDLTSRSRDLFSRAPDTGLCVTDTDTDQYQLEGSSCFLVQWAHVQSQQLDAAFSLGWGLAEAFVWREKLILDFAHIADLDAWWLSSDTFLILVILLSCSATTERSAASLSLPPPSIHPSILLVPLFINEQ